MAPSVSGSTQCKEIKNILVGLKDLLCCPPYDEGY